MDHALVLSSLSDLTGKYYRRLRELLEAVPEGSLGARAGETGLTVEETVQHVCRADAWYASLVDGTPEPKAWTASGKAGLMEALTASEGEMRRFVEGLAPERLGEEWAVPAWWGEDRDQPTLVILMHSLAHKYYHCGQLQSVVYALGAGG